MTHVSVTRHRRSYHRGVNGAWLGGVTHVTDSRQTTLEALRDWTVGDGWLEVVFADGTVETLFADTATHTGAERKFSYHPRLQAWLAEKPHA